MAAIRKFFEKKKLETKFKLAGTGHQLNAPTQRPTSSGTSRPVERRIPADGARQAGAAALARFEEKQSQPKKPTSNTATWKGRLHSDGSSSTVCNQLESRDVGIEGSNRKVTKSEVHITAGICFLCPVCPTSLPSEEIYSHIGECLLRDLDVEPLMISVTMVLTLNRNKQKVRNCVQVVSKYLQNIIDHQGEEKYRKIRKTNKVYQDKVANMKGIEEFLVKGCGFELLKMPFEVGGETSDHDFYVMSDTTAANVEQLSAAKQLLLDADPLEIILDRSVRIYEPSALAMKIDVPKSFYELSTDEIKREQNEMSTEAEKLKQLRTKAMREGDSGPKRIYRYCVIRIRFPDGIMLQGNFSSSEKLKDLRSFVTEHLSLDWVPFSLVDSIGRPYLDESATLSSLKLPPASLLNFTIESNVSEEIAHSFPGGVIQYLKDESMALIQSLVAK